MSKEIFIGLLLTIGLLSCGNKDTDAPTVTLNGEAVVVVPLNGTYEEQGATASDGKDGTLSVSISGTVNTDLEGNYEVKYRATDNAGNSTEIFRVVSVQNQAAVYAGNFFATAISTTDTTLYTAHFNTSTTVNYRIWIEGYAMQSQAVLYADIVNDSVHIAQQEVFVSGSTHYYNGAGLISQTDTLRILISFKDSTGGTVSTGNLLYKLLY